MRIATYNVEWFNALFDDDGGLRENSRWSGRYNVTNQMQLDALAHVFAAIDADAIMIIEAPDTSKNRTTVQALSQFAGRYGLRQRSSIVGFTNDTQQEIALMFDPHVLQAKHAPRSTSHAPRFDQSLKIDLDVDNKGDPVVWSKPPLEVFVTPKNGHPFEMIGVHAKSKAPHGAGNREDAMRKSIENRRKQLAQCIWLRRRVDELMAEALPTIVLGDFNDGPGLDEYEKLFGRSGVEIALGENPETALFDPHAAQALCSRFAAPTTSRFWIAHEKRFLQALLDYVMVSPAIRDQKPSWRIWHPFEDPECFQDRALHDALLLASDHFPVTLDFDPNSLNLAK